VRTPVVKPMMIHGVYSEKFNSACVNKIGQRADHALIFQLPFIPCARGESHQRRPPMAVDHHPKADFQPWGMPPVILAFHECPLHNRLCMIKGAELCQPLRIEAMSLPQRISKTD